MERKRRTELLIEGDFCLLDSTIVDLKKKHRIVTLEKPTTGLVMIKMRDPAKKQLFYLGEVLVTEAKVKIDNFIGLGIVKGNNKKLAYNLAIIDAITRGKLNGYKVLETKLVEIEKELIIKRKMEMDTIYKTKVDFVTIDEEIKA